MAAERQAWPPGGLRLTRTADAGRNNHLRLQITAGVGNSSKSSMQVLTSRQARRAYEGKRRARRDARAAEAVCSKAAVAAPRPLPRRSCR